ncbi:MAG: hypothetical protein II862_07810 [Bacteroidales bacterium]|nr:hypothetical protein [Bacteroidales bacterium]
MKKLALTIAIVLGLSMTTFADGGLFQRGNTPENSQEGTSLRGDGPSLPGHGSQTDEPAPLGSGIAVLMGLGAAYLASKKHREE